MNNNTQNCGFQPVYFDETSRESTSSQFSELQMRECMGEALAKISKEDLAERINIMLAKEEKYLPDPHYIAKTQNDGMTELWRRRVTEWLLEFQEEFYISQDTVAVAVNYMDRYLSKVSTKKSIMQLLAMGAVFIAGKLHEQYQITMKELQGLAEEMYLKSDIKLMERELLRVVQWNLNPITPQLIMQHLVHYVPCATQRQTLREHAEAFLDVALCEYSFLCYSSSVQGAAALLCAFESTRYSSVAWRSEVNEFAFLKSPLVGECKTKLMRMFEENCIPLRNDSNSPVGVEQLVRPEMMMMDVSTNQQQQQNGRMCTDDDEIEVQFQTDEELQWSYEADTDVEHQSNHNFNGSKSMYEPYQCNQETYILPIENGVIINGGTIVNGDTNHSRLNFKPVARYPSEHETGDYYAA